MAIYKLVLIPDYDKTCVEVELSPDRVLASRLNDVVPEQEFVYSDIPYCAQFRGVDDEIEKLSFFVNYRPIETEIKDDIIQFTDSQYPDRRMFYHDFGLVQFTVIISFANKPPVTLYSKFVSVLVKNERTNLSVQRMAEYVYRWRERLLLCGPLESEYRQSLKEGAHKELETQVQILQDIVYVYGENLRYFRKNAKFNLHPIGRVDNYEKAKFISSHTLNYTAQHPEHLMRSPASTGIQFGKQNFLPSKTLVEQNSIDYDIYENRVVVGFLKSLYQTVNRLVNDIRTRIEHFPDTKEVDHGYFLSAAFVFAITKRKLEKSLEQLRDLMKNVENLYIQYSKSLPVSELNIFQIPSPSTILTSVRSYRLIYEQIIRWFQFGIYDFSQEDFILPMLQSNKLYEYYVLLKLYNYIEGKGFHVYDTNDYKYDERYDADRLIYTTSENTFLFRNETMSTDLTLYYEPIIHGGKNKRVGENDVGLFRNLSFSFEDKEKKKDTITKGFHYNPDYVIKIRKGDHYYYILLDAKFSDTKSVRKYSVRKLLYEYLISLSTIDSKDKLIGLVIINGKSDKLEDSTNNIYDLATNIRPIYPIAQIITLTENQENNTELHLRLMDSLFASIID